MAQGHGRPGDAAQGGHGGEQAARDRRGMPVAAERSGGSPSRSSVWMTAAATCINCSVILAQPGRVRFMEPPFVPRPDGLCSIIWGSSLHAITFDALASRNSVKIGPQFELEGLLAVIYENGLWTSMVYHSERRCTMKRPVDLGEADPGRMSGWQRAYVGRSWMVRLHPGSAYRRLLRSVRNSGARVRRAARPCGYLNRKGY